MSAPAPPPTTPEPTPVVPARPRRFRRRRLAVVLGMALVLLLVLAATLAPASESGPADHPADDHAADTAADGDHAHGANERHPRRRHENGDTPGTTTTTTSTPAAGDDSPRSRPRSTPVAAGAVGPQLSGGTTVGGGAVEAPVGPVLVAPADVQGVQGMSEARFVIGNAGDQPLDWSVLPDEHGDYPVAPNAGTIAPGGETVVYFDWYEKPLYSTVDYEVQVTSNGGDADVLVHLTPLPIAFDVVGGTYIIRNGNTFIVPTGDDDIGLTLKNLSDAPLSVDPQEVPGLDIIGGPWVLMPNQEVHLHVVLCNAVWSGGFPDFHDRDLHIHTDSWQGTIDFGIRFTLEFGQTTNPC